MLMRIIAIVGCSVSIMFAQPVIDYSKSIRQECCGGRVFAIGVVRYTGSGFSSGIRLVENDKNHERTLWKSDISNAIGLSPIDGSRVDEKLSCVVLMFQKRGSMAVELDVVRIENENVVPLFNGVASVYEFKKFDKVNLLIGHGDMNTVDVPTIFRITKDGIVDVSRLYPGYYKELIETMPYTISDVPHGFEREYVRLCVFANVTDVVRGEIARLQANPEAMLKVTTNLKTLLDEIDKIDKIVMRQ